MFKNLFAKNKDTGRLPEYSELKKLPTRQLPDDLKEMERSESFRAARDRIEQELNAPGKHPTEEGVIFYSLMQNNAGMIVIPLPEERGGACLPTFSSPVRLIDYRRVLLRDEHDYSIISSNSLQFLQMLADLKTIKINQLTVDRCPRCEMFIVIKSGSLITSSDVLKVWVTFKSTELARLNLYMGYATSCAKAGDFQKAKDVALETVGHVNSEDCDLHLLIGKLALSVGDNVLLKKASHFLEFFRATEQISELQQAQKSGNISYGLT